jgi:hypothetical protein
VVVVHVKQAVVVLEEVVRVDVRQAAEVAEAVVDVLL